MMLPVANARMYSVAPAAGAAWAALFADVSRRAGMPLDIIGHAFPLPLADLWARTDLGCVFMCGLPYISGVADVVPVAAPVPAGVGGPRYWTDLVVRADSSARAVADTFGLRLGYTAEDSQSGYHAVRGFLRTLSAAPTHELIGPLVTPRRALEAVIDGRVDVAPLDSYAHALLRLHEPAMAAQVRVIAQTEPTPIPLLVASRGLDVRPIREALLATGPVPALSLDGFVVPPPDAEYATLLRD